MAMDLRQQKNIQADIEAISRIPTISNILEVACSSTGMGFAAVARVTDEKWIACATNDKIGFGLKVGGELKLDTTICNEIRQHHKYVAIDHVAEDPIYHNHHTPLLYGLQSYISVPIVLKGDFFFGTLCAIDPNPASVNNPQTINTFALFAELIAFHLDAQQEVSITEKKLREERRIAEIREQFIAMLGHDLRNPVNAINNASQLLLRGTPDERTLKLSTIIQDATLRVRGLIDNILDFASGRLGGGIKLSFENELSLEETLNQVITELNMVWPDVKINTSFNLKTLPKADYKRLAQLFSNLLSNAITHGKKGKPIEVAAKTDGPEFELSITNMGNKISEHAMPHLFKPFSRGKIKPGQEGLGLGLYIASEIAKAHQGYIKAESNDKKTCFKVRLPI